MENIIKNMQRFAYNNFYEAKKNQCKISDSSEDLIE